MLRNLSWLNIHLKGCRRQVAGNALLSFTRPIFTLLQVWAMKNVIDTALAPSGSVAVALALLVALTLINIFLRNASTWVHDILSVKLANVFKIKLFEKILHTSESEASAMHSGDFISRLLQDLNTIVGFTTDTLPNFFSNIILFIGAFSYMCYMNWIIAVAIIILTPVFIVIGKCFLHRLNHYNIKYRKADSQANAVMLETIQNRVIVKINCVYQFMSQKVSTMLRAVEDIVGSKSKYSMGMNTTMMLGFSVCYLLAFAWGVVDLSAGIITVGEFAAILQLVDNIQSPAQSITNLLPSFSNFTVATSRINEIEQLENEKITTMSLNGAIGISLDDVSFSYSRDERNCVIEHFSHDFKPNTCTIIKGETGKGKTTILKLMLALIKPLEGKMWVYDSTGSTIELSSGIRDYVEYVPQGNSILSGSIEYNLRIGNPNASEAQMRNALECACAEFVFEKLNGLETVCSEKGGSISEGQAQRIVIARALLRDKPILILDESTSALDEKTESRLITNLKAFPSKTIIFVTHKGNLNNIADEIINL